MFGDAAQLNRAWVGYNHATDQLILHTGSTITMDGNVGIGTTSPTHKLDVAGTGNFTGLVSGITPVAAANFVTKAYADGLTPGAGVFLPLAGGTLDSGAAINMSGTLTIDGSSSVKMLVKGGARIALENANGTDSFYIANTGGNLASILDLGSTLTIAENGGTSTFAGNVNVEGTLAINGTTFVDSTRRNIYLNSFAGGDGNGIFFRDGFTYNASITVEDHNGSSADGICISGYDGVSFSTGTNGKNERMRIATNGNVGIGTTSPTSAKLVVAGDIDVWSSTNTLLRSSHNGSYGSLQTFTSGAYGILALNPGGGNVGIGVTDPEKN
jgi:hypothetical protein